MKLLTFSLRRTCFFPLLAHSHVRTATFTTMVRVRLIIFLLFFFVLSKCRLIYRNIRLMLGEICIYASAAHKRTT